MPASIARYPTVTAGALIGIGVGSDAGCLAFGHIGRRSAGRAGVEQAGGLIQSAALTFI
jgi:hypothetical protein